MATSAIDRLSPELLHILFVHLDSPAAFSQVRRSWYATSKDPYSISQYLLAHYAKHEVLSVAISYGPVATPQVFRPLLAAGAVFSRYFAVTLQLRFAGISTDRILWRAGDKWGTRWNLSVQTFAVLMQLAEERWGTLPRSLAGLEELTAWDAWQLNAMAYHGMLVNERAEDMLALVNASPQGMGGLRLKVEVLWGEIAVLVEKFSFVCFRRDDRLYNTLARGVLLEPRLLPLLQRNGWDYTADVNNDFVRSLLCTKHPPLGENGTLVRRGQIVERSSIIATLLRDYARLSNLLYISATVAGKVEALSDAPKRISRFLSDARHVMETLETEGVLDFSLANGAPAWNEDPTAASLGRLCSQFVNSAATKDERATRAIGGPLIQMDMVLERLGAHRLGFRENWTEEHRIAVAVEQLCNEFLYWPNDLLFAEVEKDTDVPEIVTRAAKRMIRISSKGTTLLALATRSPFVVAIIEAEILLHRISLPLLPPLPAAIDPSRPLFTHRPAFLSPIAFDYAGARERYPLGLGPHPWVENYYEQGPPHIVNPSYASSVWPLEPKVYTKRVGKDVVLDRGFVTGSKLARTAGALTREERRKDHELAAWTKERVPLGGLPVAIALLDLFDKDSQVIDIVLTHAQLNMNPQVTTFYLQEDVPLRDHHLEALDRLGLPRLKVVEDYLVAREKGVALPTKAALVRVRRNGRNNKKNKRKIAQASAVVA